jgi:hypothetical protein
MKESDKEKGKAHTLTLSPAQPNATPADGKPLHLQNRRLRIHLAHKLHEPAVLAHRDLHLHAYISTLFFREGMEEEGESDRSRKTPRKGREG